MKPLKDCITEEERDLARRLLENVFGACQHTVTIDDSGVLLDDDDNVIPILSIDDSCITISPVEGKNEPLDNTLSRGWAAQSHRVPPRFVVEVVTYLPGTRHEPPDSDVTEDSTHTTIDSALLRVCELLVQEKAQAFLEREGEVREAAEIAALGAS